ncbi:MAG: translation initiation factor IF-2 [Planctomycetota bacterium]
MKIRIFALARDLGLDSKVLIDLCEEAGVPLRNALATISEEERDQVVAYIRKKGASPVADQPPEVSPVRDQAPVGRKVPVISTPPRSTQRAAAEIVEQEPVAAQPEVSPEDVPVSAAPGQPEAPQVVAETATPYLAPTAVAETPVVPPSSAVEVPADHAAATPPQPAPTLASVAPVEPPAAPDKPDSTRSTARQSVAVAAPLEPAAVASPAASDVISPASVGATPSPVRSPSPAAPLSRPAASPVAAALPAATPAAPAKAPVPPAPLTPPPIDPRQRPRMQPVREMRPIGSVKDREQAAGQTPQRPSGPIRVNRDKPTPRPLVAAPPEYVAPVVRKPKPKEEKVQKPDMSLSELVDRRSPLADQLQALRRAREEHDAGETPGAPGAPAAPAAKGRPSANRGSLLKELRESREAERQAKKQKRRKRGSAAELKTTAQISFPVTVRNLSEAIGRPAKSILGLLLRQGRMVTINDELGEDEAMEVAMELGVDLSFKRSRDIEAELLASLDHEDPSELMRSRPPIITILGHVDHGKTTMVDRIRNANVAAGEFGGITQHIAAYQVNYEGHKLTFVDTPGHAAFGEMRSRGANVTDIVVLVVAADDGVMPQTVECISHAKNAGVPVVVALNKIDLPGVNEDRILQQLAQHEILPAEWGGEYEVVRTSGATGRGIDKLLETLILTAELHEIRANPQREALGVCLESFRDEGRGALAWFIVQKGTLRIGDVVLCGSTYGRIRAMYNDRDELIEEAGPSVPVKISGLSDVPGAGDHFFVMKDIEEARETAESRLHEGRRESLSNRVSPRTLEDILNQPRDGEGVQDLPLILKADSPGSIEALRSEIGKFEHPEVRVEVIHYGIGGVNESDVYLASAAGAIIIAFHVVAEDRAQTLAEREGVEIRRYNIIYEVTDHIRLALQGLLRPERVEVSTGRAIVLRTFNISRFGTIAGCRVLNGTISRDSRIHLIRDQKVLNDYRIGSLKREKDDAKEVRDGMECGIRLEGFNDVKEGDLLEAYRIDEIKRTLT